MTEQTAAQRIARIASALLTRSEREVDEVLRAAGARPTSSDWSKRPQVAQRMELHRLLGDLGDRTLALVENALLEAGDVSPPEPTAQGPIAPARPVIFVVHGRDHASLHELVRSLERATLAEVIILHERANAGRLLFEKFQYHADLASFAVILLTGDDIGGLAGAHQTKRARQNVIFELGYFFGKLGRQQVAVLLDADVERPSDIDGLVYIPLDDSGAWKLHLARELSSGGISVDYAKLP